MSALTPQDLERLRLPGTIPGLLRRCSPCQTEWGAFVVVNIEGRLYTVQSLDSAGLPMPVTAEHLALDLTDPTGQAHALWHLGACLDDKAIRWCRAKHPQWTIGLWCLDGLNADHFYAERWTVHLRGVGVTQTVVPGLAGLDFTDERTLPDGRRYVDVLALVLVCEHVAGVDRG